MRYLSDEDYTPASDFPQQIEVFKTSDLRLADWPEGPFMTVRDIARVIRCHPETVRRWIREGKLPAYRFPGKGKNRTLRIDEAALSRFLEEGECLGHASHQDCVEDAENQIGMSATARRFFRLGQKIDGRLNNG